MKRFWLEIIGLGVFLLAFTIIVDVFYRSYPTQAYVRIEKNGGNKSAEVIYIGNSHIGVLGTVCLDTNSNCSVKNLAFTGITYPNIDLLLRNFSDSSTRLVVIGLEFDLFFVKNNSSIEYELLPYLNDSARGTIKKALPYYSTFFRSGRDIKWFYKSRNDIVLIHEQDFIPQKHPKESDELCWVRSKMFSEIDSSVSKELGKDNLRVLDSLIRYLKNKNISVALIIAPKRDCFVRNYALSTSREAKVLITDLATRNNVYFKDFTESHWEDSLFSDYDHLNSMGSRVLLNELKASMPYSINKKL